MNPLLILTFLFLAACVKPAPATYWAGHGDDTVLKRDLYECERDMRSTNFRGAGNRSIGTGRDAAAALLFGGDAWARSQDEKARREFYMRCMEIRGWELRQERATVGNER